MLAPIVCCARVPQNGCNGDFVIDCGGTGGTIGIVHSDVLCLSVHVCASATYPRGIGEVHGMDMHAPRPSWLGQSKKLAVFWTSGESTRGVRSTSTSTNVRIQRTAVFWHAPAIVIRDVVL